MSFSFGAPASNGGSGKSLFGTAGNSNTGSSPGSLFGNIGASTSGSSSPSMFGTSSATGGQGSTLFGGATGSAATPSSGTTAFSFGTQNKPAGTTQAPSLFGSGSQTPKTNETPSSGQTPAGGLFGNAAKPAGGLFANATSTPGQSGGSIFGNTASTTPAGPPPQGGATGQPQSLFGQTAQKPGGLFGNVNTTSSSSTTPTTATAPSTNPLFGGAPQTQTQSNGGGGLFGSNTQNTQQKPLFGSTPAAPAGGNLFGNANKPAESTTPTTSADTAPKPLFGAAPTPSTGGTTSAQTPSLFQKPAAGTDSAPKPAFSLGTTNTSAQPSTTSAASSATPQKSLFPAIGGTTSSTTPSTTPAAAPSGGMFSALGAAKPTGTTAPSTTATAPPATQPAAPTGGLFGNKPAGTTASSQPSTTSATPAAATDASKPSLTTPSAPATSTATGTTGATATSNAATGGAALGASTAGPTPPAQSRLKNKTMDEIITRWATDLTKYQKDFKEQAEKVAEWDRMLVENGTKVQKLYGSTVDAERATQEVERQLASVEGQQEELGSWLDRYEREVDEMMSKQVGPGESLQGPDQERERTYKLAEKLSERLDEMGKDLTSMIEEVNGASATLSKTNKADEPISQIVRILNSHLSQLQVIDQGTSELQTKVSAAQKAGQSLSSRFGYGFSSSGMANSTAADDFYRSYMGRR
ncbi:Nsp1-like C-terminal region-domain-containing protein [Aspergillus flavus]|uniref:Nucleoporin NSP1 n=4 Tax=Aspergillus subgen. Circumdati TaxID=2720871 RepID=Q2U6F7_ASPOR|nr:unnamed protein product [Aspergillus oryzae RIB40]EIT78511.1 nuclear porin [Aspergillus oryzae 3.042]KAB8241136.1 Nsp1-like C-terminal region-domain-containing protein [Aspergillus flavus]KDE83123.1 nuclear porin [Aspergillus oryzae 100-8]OOO05489.1 Nucleoporin, Nsp1-like domain-containing protein [Aspergillus oryzae]RAQ73976.1 nucleoporin Nsp1 [Aspergillus flavus]|eukprot:EIT78511.1 nuclear porin [Aspergillus oryzae 3.042]